MLKKVTELVICKETVQSKVSCSLVHEVVLWFTIGSGVMFGDPDMLSFSTQCQ